MSIQDPPPKSNNFPQKNQGSYPSLNELQSRLGGHFLQDGQLRTYCPVHGGEKPKLDIKDDVSKDGQFIRILVCRSCGKDANKDIIKSLQGMGLWPSFGKDVAPLPPRQFTPSTKSKKTKKEQYSSIIFDLYQHARNQDPTLALEYMRGRGVDLHSLAGGALHERLKYASDDKAQEGYYPALLLPIYGRWDQQIKPGTFEKSEKLDIVGLQRIYLTSEGKKAPLDPNKKVLGQMKGGAFFLSPLADTGKMMCICEGGETAFALQDYFDRKIAYYKERVTVAAAISAQNLSCVPIPKGIKRILIAADKDRLSRADQDRGRKPAGERFAEEARQFYISHGYKCKVIYPQGPIPEGQKSLDFLDVLGGEG